MIGAKREKIKKALRAILGLWIAEALRNILLS